MHKRLDAGRTGRELAIVGGLLLMAAAVRLYGLAGQSLWYDDYFGYCHVQESDLRAYLEAFYSPTSVNAEHVPLYFLAEFAWGEAFGKSPEHLRWFSVLLNLLTLPFVYLLARRVFGVTAAVVAGGMLALSPFHVFYAQSLRPYMAVALLASISLYALVIALEKGRPMWWGIHVLCNLLLLWTHLFSVFLLAAQGAALLTLLPRRWRTILAWGGAHALLFLPSLVWAFSQMSMPATAYDIFRKPSPVAVFFDIFADDALTISGLTHAATPIPPGMSGAWGLIAARVGTGLECLLALATTAAVLGMAFMACNPRDAHGKRDRLLLLLAVAVLPAAALGVLSVVWRPCMFPRYTTYSTLAVYALMGGAVQMLPRRGLQAAACGLLVILLAYPLAIVSGRPVNTQWNEAAAHVAAHAGPGDPVLVGCPGGAQETGHEIFRGYFPAERNPILLADSVTESVAKASCLLAGGAAPGVAQVWAVFNMGYAPGPLPDFEKRLREAHMDHEFTNFPAMEGVSVYRVTRAAGFAGGTGMLPSTCTETAAEAAGAYLESGNLEGAAPYINDAAAAGHPVCTQLAPLLAGEGERGRVLEAFGQVRLGRQRLAEVNLKGAAEAFRRARAVLPEVDMAREELATALLGLGLAYSERGNAAPALDALKEAGGLVVEIEAATASLRAALTDGADAANAAAAMRMLLRAIGRAGMDDYVPMLERVVKTDPRCAYAQFLLGKALVALGQYGRALEALNQHNELQPAYAPAWQETVRAVLGAGGRRPEATTAMQRWFALDPTAEERYGALADAVLGHPDAARAKAEMDSLTQAGVEVFPEFRRAIEMLASESGI